MKRILIVGASSFVGLNLAHHLRREYSVYGTYRRYPPRIDGVPSFRLDIVPGAPIEALVRAVKPHAVIYCAGTANERQCNQDTMATLYLNADGPALFAEALKPRAGQLIYLSTSKVFSGDIGDYNESHEISPRTTYGRAKLRGEELIAQFDNTLTLRIGNIVGWAGARQNCFLRRLIGQLWAGEEIPLICDEYRNFIAVDEVARHVKLAVERALVGGPYHLSDGGKMTFYGFARIAAKAFGLPTTLLRATTGETYSRTIDATERGKDLSLDGSELARELGISPAPLEGWLSDLRVRLASGAQ